MWAIIRYPVEKFSTWLFIHYTNLLRLFHCYSLLKLQMKMSLSLVFLLGSTYSCHLQSHIHLPPLDKNDSWRIIWIQGKGRDLGSWTGSVNCDRTCPLILQSRNYWTLQIYIRNHRSRNIDKNGKNLQIEFTPPISYE